MADCLNIRKVSQDSKLTLGEKTNNMNEICDPVELISIPILSRMLGVPVKTIRAWVYKREIPYYKLGKLVRFNLKDIKVWVESKKVQSLTSDLIKQF